MLVFIIGVVIYMYDSRLDSSNCVSDSCLQVSNLEYPVTQLPDSIVKVLNDALLDEYRAYSTYASVVGKYGAVRPFIMIMRAEEQHIASLKALFDKYGVEVPENTFMGNVSVAGSVAEACRDGVAAETGNVNLYKNTLLPLVTEYQDITKVFTNLMNASETRHLPAFTRCS